MISRSRVYARELDLVTVAGTEAADLLVIEAQRPQGPRGSGDKADVDAEIGALLCERIRSAFPYDTIICEEGGGHQGNSGRAFIIDPHDGTYDFLNGRRETSISIALVDHGSLVLGAIFAPFSTELTGPAGLHLTWCQGGLVLHNGQPAEVFAQDINFLDNDSLVLVSANLSPVTFAKNAQILHPATLRTCPSIATRLALVALGRATLTLTIRKTLASWDFAGGHALLKAVGGEIVGPQGRPISWQGVGVHPADRSIRGYFAAQSRALAVHVSGLFQSMILES